LENAAFIDRQGVFDVVDDSAPFGNDRWWRVVEESDELD
jgi:hypothetical protein